MTEDWNEVMSSRDLYRARLALGLDKAQMAAVLDTNETSVKKWETSPANASHRPPPARVVRLIRAYLEGYRPADWPVTEEAAE